MKINAIFVKSTNEILYSRHRHDCKYSSDMSNFIDGGFDYVRLGGDLDNIISLQLDGDTLLKSILFHDYNYGNKEIQKEHIDGYHGRYELTSHSNIDYFSKLVVNWDDIKRLCRIN